MTGRQAPHKIKRRIFGPMKTAITRKLLKKDYAARNRELRRMFLFAAVFCLLCVALVPVRLIGLAVAGAVMGIAFASYARGKRLGQFGDVGKAYFRLLPVTGKEESQHGDPESGYSSSFYLCFGEHGAVEALKFNDYKEAEEGRPYYVAFFSESDKPFACFDAEAYDLDPGFEVRQ